MLDLTGGNLAAYMLRQVRDIVTGHPRYRQAQGEVVFSSNNSVLFKDVQVQFKNLSTQGNRLSPDYFLTTQHGRALHTKIKDKDSSFIEWIREFGSADLDAGVYYLNVDSVNEETRAVTFTRQSYKWRQGVVQGCVGSIVYLASGIDPNDVTPVDSTIGFTPGPKDTIQLNTASTQVPLQLKHISTNNALVPNIDFWYQRELDVTLTNSTLGGYEDLTVPANYITIKFVDQDDYQLQEGIDFEWTSPTTIRLGFWTPNGSKVIAKGIYRVDPNTAPSYHPENLLGITLLPGETLVAQQVFITTPDGQFGSTDLIVLPDNSLLLKNLIAPGGWYRWEARIDTGQATVTGKKRETNTTLVPGLIVAVGDLCTVGDQCAILVAPQDTETYELYGSKENVSFDLEVKANDLMTASEIAERLRDHLLIRNRDGMEADGLTIFEISKSNTTRVRDNSGTASSFSFVLSVTAAADWTAYVPMVTRLVDIEVEVGAPSPDFSGKVQPAAKIVSLGAAKFIPWYA